MNFFIIAIILFALILAFKAIKIIPQGYAGLISNLGSFSKTV